MTVSERFGDYVIEAISTAEERQGTQPRSLLSIAFNTMTLSEEETGLIRKTIEAAGEIPMAMPVWPGQCKLTKDAVVGNSFVYCDDTAGGLFDICPFVILWRDYDKFETFRLFAVGDNGVQLDRPITGEFLEGDMIVPLIVGKFSKNAVAAMTDTFGEFPVKFDEQFIVEGYAEANAITGDDALTLLHFEYQVIGGEIVNRRSLETAPDFHPVIIS